MATKYITVGGKLELTQARKMTARQRGSVMASVRRMDNPKTCEHGHWGCSNKHLGACLDECMALNGKV